MENIKIAQNILRQYNQEEIVEALNSLTGTEKEELVEQILKIDFEEITNLYKNVNNITEQKLGDVKPIDVIDKEKISENEKKELEDIGLNIIKQNQYAVITMAGRTRNSSWMGWSKRYL